VWSAVEDLQGTAEQNLWVERETVTSGGDSETSLAQVVRQGEDLGAAKARLEAEGIRDVFRIVTLKPATKQLYVVLALLFWTPILWWLVKRTRTGKAMRAVSEDADAARLMGIPIDRTVSATFFIGGFLGGVAGVAYCMTDTTVAPLIGYLPGLKAFVAAVIGGIGSIPGAIVGGLILGLAESVIPYGLQQAGWASAFAWKDAIAFALLILILVLKPTGLLGKPMREKV
jgi:branched-chain amino acid transport system permease protein